MMLAKSLVPPQGGRSQVRFGAEFQGIGTVDGVATEPESLSSRFSRFALKIFDRFVIFRDLFGFFLCWHLLHLAISTQSQSTDTLVDKCAVSAHPAHCGPAPPAPPAPPAGVLACGRSTRGCLWRTSRA